ncbi:MAG TPA: hypothetical protein VFA70_03260 [Dehalococcoidia bacterium]|nr:hypothetical protein [Dehalococcoidia bacterium]
MVTCWRVAGVSGVSCSIDANAPSWAAGVGLGRAAPVDAAAVGRAVLACVAAAPAGEVAPRLFVLEQALNASKAASTSAARGSARTELCRWPCGLAGMCRPHTLHVHPTREGSTRAASRNELSGTIAAPAAGCRLFTAVSVVCMHRKRRKPLFDALSRAV